MKRKVLASMALAAVLLAGCEAAFSPGPALFCVVVVVLMFVVAVVK